MLHDMHSHPSSPMELLAPAGTLDVFEAAIDCGADAVYVGAPFMNARALAKPFRMNEIAAMTDHAHAHGARLYIAMNSLLKDSEGEDLLTTLWQLSEIGVDALIIQDMGVYRFVRQHFPQMRIHASTLCTAHNSIAVRQLQQMGFERVVLARELTLDEIAVIRRETTVELEVFVHGAMCFGYSGLCLFSSYLGGKSGLRGRCVQPCRRRYQWRNKNQKGHQGGYLFSMNDLEGIHHLTQLRKSGVGSIKIEGRMRSREYVAHVVRAYRLLLDSDGKDKTALDEAEHLLQQALGRKGSDGYFVSPKNAHLISPYHSGNMGQFVGAIQRRNHGRAVVMLKCDLHAGDRLRVHHERSGDRQGFTLKELWLDGAAVRSAAKGRVVELLLPPAAVAQDSLYKVSSKKARADEKGRTLVVKKQQKWFDPKYMPEILRRRAESLQLPSVSTRKGAGGKGKKQQKKGGRPGQGRIDRSIRLPVTWWLKLDTLATLSHLGKVLPDTLLFVLTPDNLSKTARILGLQRQFKNVVLSFPSIIEEADISKYRNAVKVFAGKGFRDWQLGHIGQLQFFQGVGSMKRFRFYGDWTLNVLNSFSVELLKNLQFYGCQISLEADHDTINSICKRSKGMQLGLTVYGFPPLFIARAQPDFFQFGATFISPKKESFVLEKRFEQTTVRSTQPFSLLPWLSELVAMGVHYVVIDLSSQVLHRGTVATILRQADRPFKKKGMAATFNYRGTLL